MVTFQFKPSNKSWKSHFWNFFRQLWKKCHWIQLVRIIFDKKMGKTFFFWIFLKQKIFFMAKFEFYMKNAFFWGIYCWCSSKIAKIEIFRIFCSNYTKTVIFGFFYAFWKKKILKIGFINWKWSQLSEKCVFGALWCSRAKITRGVQSWQAFLDVSLIRVSFTRK